MDGNSQTIVLHKIEYNFHQSNCQNKNSNKKKNLSQNKSSIYKTECSLSTLFICWWFLGTSLKNLNKNYIQHISSATADDCDKWKKSKKKKKKKKKNNEHWSELSFSMEVSLPMDSRTDKRLNKYQFSLCLLTYIQSVSLFRHTIGRLHECSEFNIVVKLVSVSYWPPRGNNLIWTCVTSLKLNLIFSQNTSAAQQGQLWCAIGKDKYHSGF